MDFWQFNSLLEYVSWSITFANDFEYRQEGFLNFSEIILLRKFLATGKKTGNNSIDFLILTNSDMIFS